MKKIYSILTIIPLLALWLSPLSLTYGANQDFKFVQPKGFGVDTTTSGGEELVENILVNSLGLFFTVGGIGVIVYFVWGAVDWILSGGDKEKVAAARKKMTHAIIGLVLLALSFVIINLVGQIVGFNPLGNLQLRDLGTPGDPLPNKDLSN